ncbi:MAG: hypothetical protein ACT4NX_03860 [Deltaproteobacteria bacterium]
MVNLELRTLTVVKKADIARDEPRLWPMYIVLSLETINSREFVVTVDPLQGKLPKAGRGDAVAIPASVGRFQRDAGGIGMAGVFVLAFDNDLRSKNQIKDGYAAAAALNQAIIDHFPVYGFAPVGEEEEKEIGEKIRAAVKGAFLDRSIFLTLAGGKPVGGEAFTRIFVGLDELDEPISMTLRAKKDRAIYRIDGRLQFSR